jgi:hypothetical protein
MDPSELHGPPQPERPTPAPPAWVSGGGQTGEGPPEWATRGAPTVPGSTAGGVPGTPSGFPGEPGWPGWAPPPVPPARRGRRAGWVVAVVVVLAAALVAGMFALRSGVGVEQPPRQPATQGPATQATADPQAEVPKLLARRARAILRGDRAAFLATVDRRRGAYYRSQAKLFASMRTVPFSTVDYQVTDPRNWATATVRRRYAPDRVYLPHVQLRYRFKGQDASPVLGRLFYTFVLTRSGWRIGGQEDARPALRDDVQIWDGGPVKTLRTGRTLVVYHPGSEQLAGRLLAAAERGYGEVAAVWTGRWERKVVILVPRDQDEAERLVHARDLSPVAALSASSVESGPGGRVLGNRIVVNPAVLAPYRNLDLQNVVTHEMTHVATRTLGNVPLFLVEGFAEYTALRPFRRYPPRLTRPMLAARVRAGRFDGRLPSARELRGRDGVVAYDEASTFCLWVVESYGEGKLLALYRAFAGSKPPNAAELDLGFREVLGVSKRTAEARWAAWVRARL